MKVSRSEGLKIALIFILSVSIAGAFENAQERTKRAPEDLLKSR